MCVATCLRTFEENGARGEAGVAGARAHAHAVPEDLERAGRDERGVEAEDEREAAGWRVQLHLLRDVREGVGRDGDRVPPSATRTVGTSSWQEQSSV